MGTATLEFVDNLVDRKSQRPLRCERAVFASLI
jgi:hypothetical protein